MQTFDEGLAQFVEQRLESRNGVADTDRLQAAVVSQRNVLVQLYGTDAPAKLLSTLGRPDFPRDLEGLTLWQTAFQLSGFNLGLVFDDYATRVKQ